jgi:Icc-related predicted phosphoesterase
MTYEKYMDAYNWSLEFLSDMVNMSGFNVVGIVTHHSPSMQSLHERYRDSTMNHFFHNDTDDLVKALNPKVWIHGHTHDESFYKLGDTQVICNPRGYPNEYNHKGYEPIYYDLEV